MVLNQGRFEQSLTARNLDRVPRGRAPRDLNPLHKGHLVSPLFLCRGIIRAVIPERRAYSVALEDGSVITCTTGSSIVSFMDYGASELFVLFPGTEVLVARSPEEPHGVIICAIPFFHELKVGQTAFSISDGELTYGGTYQWRDAYKAPPGTWSVRTRFSYMGIDVHEFLVSIGSWLTPQINLDGIRNAVSIFARRFQFTGWAPFSGMCFGSPFTKNLSPAFYAYIVDSGLVISRHTVALSSGYAFLTMGEHHCVISPSLTVGTNCNLALFPVWPVDIQDPLECDISRGNPHTLEELPEEFRGLDQTRVYLRKYGNTPIFEYLFRVSQLEFQFKAPNAHFFSGVGGVTQLASRSSLTFLSNGSMSLFSYGGVIIEAPKITFRCDVFQIASYSGKDDDPSQYYLYWNAYDGVLRIKPSIMVNSIYADKLTVKECLYDNNPTFLPPSLIRHDFISYYPVFSFNLTKSYHYPLYNDRIFVPLSRREG